MYKEKIKKHFVKALQLKRALKKDLDPRVKKILKSELTNTLLDLRNIRKQQLTTTAMKDHDGLIQTTKDIMANREAKDCLSCMSNYLPNVKFKLKETQDQLTEEEARTERMEKIQAEYDNEDLSDSLPF